MAKYFKPFELWGTIGGLALGYRTIRNDQDRNRKINLFDAGLFTCVGYIIGESLPIVTPIMVAVAVFEEVQRQSSPTTLQEAVWEAVREKD
jgi:hypothetical protein